MMEKFTVYSKGEWLEHFSVTMMSGILVFLILASGFFSGSEIGMMSLNRYRLRHQVKKKFKPAQRVNQLLSRQDRLLGVILIGNTIANLLASSVVTLLAARLYGDLGVTVGMISLTLVILIFCEIAPKTVAALYPERIAYLVSVPLTFILKMLSPMVALANFLARLFLACFGIKVSSQRVEHLSGEELRTVVSEAGAMIPTDHKDMLVSILDLEHVTVEDIMIPKHEIIGIDLTDPWDEILDQLQSIQHTRLPVYRESLDNVIGLIHSRSLLQLVVDEKLTLTTLTDIVEDAHFIPEGTLVTVQLLNFKKSKQRSGFVVDEYGDIQGLVVVEDILEEIVGEFTTDMAVHHVVVHPQDDGSYIVDGGVLVRELNRDLSWHLPTDGPKTLSGVITEYLETIPTTGTCLLINGYPIEVIAIKDNRIKSAKILPRLARVQPDRG